MDIIKLVTFPHKLFLGVIMKKIFKKLIYLVFFGSLILAFAGCKNSSFVLVDGSNFRGQIADSEIFIDGRVIKIDSFFISLL